MRASELKDRTRHFAVDVLKLARKLPNTIAGKAVAQPLVRCGTAVGAMYRRTCKSRNHYDFMSGISVVEEAADETCYWFEVALESQLLKPEDVTPLLDEGKALKKILTRSRRVAEKRFKQRSSTSGSGSDSEDIPF